MHRLLGAHRLHTVRRNHSCADAPAARASATDPALQAIRVADSQTARGDPHDVPRKRSSEAAVVGAPTRGSAGAGAMRSHMDERTGSGMVGNPRTGSPRTM